MSRYAEVSRQIMAVLGDAGALSQRQLSQATLMDKVPVNRACKRLEDRGLIRRTPNRRDGRSHLLELTEEGWAVHGGVMPLAQKIEAEMFAILSDAERAQLRDILHRVRENAGEFDAESLAD